MDISQFSHSEYVITTIGALTLIGAILQIAAFIRYSSEIKYIGRLKEKIFGLLRGSEPSPLSAEDLIEEERVPQNSMVATRTKELEKFAQYPGMVALHDLGAVAAEADAGRIRNAIPNMLIASLLVCGLFGTLLSLKETLQDDALKSFISKEGIATTSTFQGSLDSVLDGFGKAFLASLFGVGGTIVLLFIRIFVRAMRETCFERLEQFVVECLLPYYIEPEKTQLQKATASIGAATNRFGDISREMDKSAEAISLAVNGLESAMADAAEAFGNDGSVAYQLSRFTEQAELFTQSTENISESNIKASEMLTSLGQKQEELIEKQEKRIASTEDNRKKLTERLSDFIKSVSEDNQKLAEEFSNGIQGLIEAQENAIKQATERHKAEEGHLDSLIKSLGEGQEALINNLHESYKANSEQIVVLNRELVEENRSSISAVISNLELVSTKLDDIVLKEDRVDLDAFYEFRAYLGSIHEKLEAVLVVNGDAVDKAQRMHQKLDQNLIKSFEDFSTRITALARVIDRIAEAGSIEQETLRSKIKRVLNLKV